MNHRLSARAARSLGSVVAATIVLAGLVASPAHAATASPTPSSSATPKASPTPTPKPTASPTPKPTASPTPKPTASPTPKPTASPTPKPTASPTPKPTPTPTPTPKPVVIPKKLTKGTTKGGTTVVLPLVAKTYAITSGYGARCIPVKGGSTFHYGLDMSEPDGTPIYAVATGKVTSVHYPSGGTAGYISVRSVIDGQVTYLAYIHMWNPGKYVKLGQNVSVGQHIADVGASGPASGPHLHLEVWKNAFYGSGTSVNPATWLTAQGLPVVSLAKASYARAAPKTCTYYPTANLRLRAGASTSTKIITTLPANTKLTNEPGVKVNGFIPVSATIKGKTLTGWVSASYISQYKTYSVGKTTSLRQKATSSSHKILTAKKGRSLTVITHGTKWSKVRVSGYAGYLPTKYVRNGY
ncbi:peptidoglycan DD-metalloendopeptidase family protein [Cellulomonas sp. JH27-2]|uniref:peptidoglycan DD-metalloendopeptidase family protein n=1 Tax=Cellulomonas sp. JH27-2 TaxID=2774139 RepID=UPI001780EDE7|nr:peptidoglycan DD-metalloendopeptidase family protein [Cellulomonas sp. JH27-2]MBD8060166.1 peptidoglycan DD-metalloendopeptidase family protein [Cellulomonas sp. JH27-2]